jgi:hypothetical protein
MALLVVVRGAGAVVAGWMLTPCVAGVCDL